MKIQLIKVKAREPRGRIGLARPYLRGRDVHGQVLRHELAYSQSEEYLVVDGQTIPDELLPLLQEKYPGSERMVKANVINTLNMKPTPLYAEAVTVEIEKETTPAASGGESDADPYAEMSRAGLMGLCEKAGLETSGNKDVLKARLKEAGVVPVKAEE